jgi:hypothetical protein
VRSCDDETMHEAQFHRVHKIILFFKSSALVEGAPRNLYIALIIVSFAILNNLFIWGTLPCLPVPILYGPSL